MTNLVRTQAAAQFLDMSPGTLQWWRSVGKGPPFVKVGEAVRYRLSDLELWLAEHTVEPEKDSN